MLVGLSGMVSSGPVSPFSENTQSFIDTFSVSDRIYLDANNGDDTTGDGSVDLPYQSLTKAIQSHSGAAGQVIILFAGVYIDDVDDLTTYWGTTTSFNPAYGNFPAIHDYTSSSSSIELHIVGVGGQVFIRPDFSGKSRPAFISFGSELSTIRGCIIQRDNQGITANYATAVTPSAGFVSKGTALNCVFEEINANGVMSFTYGASHTCSFNNCTFVATAWKSSYTASTSILFDSCQVGYTGTVPENGGVFTNTTRGANFGLDYSSDVDNFTAGVYSGMYGWDTI